MPDRTPDLVPLPTRIELASSEMESAPRSWRTPSGDGQGVVRARLDQLGRSTSSDGDLEIVTATDPAIEPEGYRLETTSERAQLTARDERGFRHATTALDQLAHCESGVLPVASIVDAPRFEWRGAHLDVSRHFFDAREVERFLDLLALHRMNVFHWHLVDDHGWRIEIPALPRLTEIGGWRTENGERYGGHYSPDEIDRVVQYATERGITVVPEIELPGHSRAALAAYPQFSCRGEELPVPTEWGVFEDVYCAGSEEVFEFLATVFDEVVRRFPGETVHVGGDECPVVRWESCPRCEERQKREGLTTTADLHGWFIGRAARMLAERGRRTIGWDEILDGPLPDRARVMSWRGMDGAIEAVRAGHEAVLCPMSHCYLDHQQADDDDELGRIGILPLERIVRWEPIPTTLSEEQSRAIIGLQGNVWTEGIRSRDELDHMTLPRIAALAEVAWSSSESRAGSDLLDRLPTHLRRLSDRGYAHRSLDGAGSKLRRTTLEICVDDLESLEIAIRGGADRVEICSRLDLDGLTPSADVISRAMESQIETIAMVRPRAGDFVYSGEDRTRLLEDLAMLVDAGCQAFAFGALTEADEIDEELCAEVIEHAPGPVTFHRAFDRVPDRESGLETAIRLGFRRVLTSGRGEVAIENTEDLARSVELAKGRIEIVAAGGVRAGHAVALIRRTRVPAVHSSARGPDGCDLTIVRALETIAHP